MAAEMVSCAVAQEAVNQVLSRFKDRYEHKSDAKEHMERMEMAHIKLEAAVEISNRWNVTSPPLLRWRGKLKRAAQECDETLRRCRQRLQEEEEMQKSVRGRSSFPIRIAYSARSFVSSIFSGGGREDDELRGSAAARRFERFADGANEFLRYVELGGTPRRYMFFEPLIRHLLTGRGTNYCFVDGNQHMSFLLRPFSRPDHGMEAALVLLLEDANASENNFLLALNLRLSESTDIVGVAVSCLQLFIPHLRSTVEIVKTKLTQVPTQDLCWVSDAYTVCGCPDHQNSLYTIFSKWFRPNPLCCQRQGQHYTQSYNATSSSFESLFPCHRYMEPIHQVYLLGHVALPVGNNRREVVNGERKTSRTRDIPYLKLGVHFWPHSSSEDLPPAVRGSATEIINREAAHHGSLYANICFEQLGDILLPKAVDCLCGNVSATSYEMMWKSKHGRAFLQVEKMPGEISSRKDMGRKRHERQRGNKVQGWASANNEFMNSWIAHAPVHLQRTVVDWVQKEKRLAHPLSLKTNSCVGDCPLKFLSLQYHRSLARNIKSFSMLSSTPRPKDLMVPSVCHSGNEFYTRGSYLA